jgi:hypothetical protein
VPRDRLTQRGRDDYPDFLLDAAENGDVASFAAALRADGRLNDTEMASRNGRQHSRRVPVNAPETLAEGEFNRFYARGLCRRAIDDVIEDVIIYRAKAVTSPRPESEAKIGTAVNAAFCWKISGLALVSSQRSVSLRGLTQGSASACHN